MAYLLPERKGIRRCRRNEAHMAPSPEGKVYSAVSEEDRGASLAERKRRWEVCRMRLGQKNLLYSMALASVMMLFLIGYFIYMLPSLYVDHVMEQNLKSIYEQHSAYMEKHSYEDVRVKNATACFSVEIPLEGDSFLVTGKSFSASVTVRDGRLAQILERCRRKLETGERNLQSGDSEKGGEDDNFILSDDNFILSDEMEELAKVLQTAVGDGSFPLEISLLHIGTFEDDFFNESVKVHTYSGDLVILESSVEDAHNRYANYIAFEQTRESLVLSFLPVVAPDVDEIRPVVLRSLPMLGAVIVLLVLLFSQMYSRGIVGPIERVARHAGEMEAAGDFRVRRLSEEWPDRRDEVRELADTLDDFYRQIGESYQKLEEKNQELAEENRRQETFLRASSHQLKTPIAAALLLVDGMLNEVGRYRDTKAYLPRVKEQLLSMRKMVEEILYLNRCAEECSLQSVDVRRLLEERLRSYRVELAESGIEAELRMEEPEGGQGAARQSERPEVCRQEGNRAGTPVRSRQEAGQAETVEDSRREAGRTETSEDSRREAGRAETSEDSRREAGRTETSEDSRREAERSEMSEDSRREAGRAESSADGAGFLVTTDERMITQILDNLLSNAVKYTPPEGHIRILLQASNGMGRPEIRIMNSGVMISEDLLPHIFDPFVSGRHVRSSALGSHGLGLYIASYYAKKLNATLTVSNTEDGVAAVIIL